jgi:hypothetical protein
MEGLLETLKSEVLKGIAVIVGGALTWAAAQVIDYLRTKKKIAINEDVERRILNAIPVGIKYAEERARREWVAVQDPTNPTTEALSGEQKMEEAKKTVASIVPEFKKLPEDTQAAYIDAKLLELRQKLTLPPLSARPSQVPINYAVPQREALRAPALPNVNADDKEKR